MINDIFLRKYTTVFILVSWVGISLMALGGMYKLWWERERSLYLGKSVEHQRTVINQGAGLSTELLGRVYQMMDLWPTNISYNAVGDHNQLSYAKYLLIPRLPSGSQQYLLTVGTEDQQDIAVVPNLYESHISFLDARGFFFPLFL